MHTAMLLFLFGCAVALVPEAATSTTTPGPVWFAVTFIVACGFALALFALSAGASPYALVAMGMVGVAVWKLTHR